VSPALLRLLACLVCLVLVIEARAQVTISGKITDAAYQTLPGINVTLHPPKGTSIIAFGLTDAQGQFSIPLKSDLDSIRIRVYGLG
jgi:hypothetical protein